MKKPFMMFLLGIAYTGVVAALLFAHIQMITGQTERFMAMIETFLLVIPAIVLLYLYIQVKESDEKSTSDKAKEEPEGRKETAVTSYGQLRRNTEAYGLSERESEVAWLLYKGYTNRQISEELFIAESTVKKHASHIYEKMQVSGRKEFKEKVRISA